jgi:hypothetical protein
VKPAPPDPLPAVAAQQQELAARITLQWVGPPPFEYEPWVLAVRLVGAKEVPALSVRSWDIQIEQYAFGIERRVGDAWENVRNVHAELRGCAQDGMVLWCEFWIRNGGVIGKPGEYRLRMNWSGREGHVGHRWDMIADSVAPAISDWLPVTVTAHPGNHAAMAQPPIDLWHPWGLIVGAPPIYPAVGDLAATEKHWLNAIAWSKAETLSPALRTFGALFEAEATMTAAGYRVDQAAAATRSLWSRAQRLLEQIDTGAWRGPTGGLAADVLRARIECARWSEGAGGADRLMKELLSSHPHAWPPAERPRAPLRWGATAVR